MLIFKTLKSKKIDTYIKLYFGKINLHYLLKTDENIS